MSVAEHATHPFGVGKVMGSMLGPNRAIAKDVKSWTNCCYIRCVTLIVCEVIIGLCPNRHNSVPCTVRTPDIARAIKGLFVCNDWHLEPLVMLNYSQIIITA